MGCRTPRGSAKSWRCIKAWRGWLRLLLAVIGGKNHGVARAIAIPWGYPAGSFAILIASQTFFFLRTLSAAEISDEKSGPIKPLMLSMCRLCLAILGVGRLYLIQRFGRPAISAHTPACIRLRVIPIDLPTWVSPGVANHRNSLLQVATPIPCLPKGRPRRRSCAGAGGQTVEQSMLVAGGAGGDTRSGGALTGWRSPTAGCSR